MFNNPYPYYNNILNQFQSFKILPIPRIEEAENIYPDFNGNPLFFYDQTKNEIYVKQRNTKNGSIQQIKYVPSGEPINHVETKKDNNSYQEEINELKSELQGLKDMLKLKKEVKKDDE